jgi:hypothetical protein
MNVVQQRAKVGVLFHDQALETTLKQFPVYLPQTMVAYTWISLYSPAAWTRKKSVKKRAVFLLLLMTLVIK